MMGPLLSYRDDEDLERLLSAVRVAGIDVAEEPAKENQRSFWFRRGWGLIHGTASTEWGEMSRTPAAYFGFGHPFNPFLWWADERLLRVIKRTFTRNGSKEIN